MIPILISGHSPADDYKRIYHQASYVLTYPETGSADVPEQSDNFRNSGRYKRGHRIFINLLKLSGIGAIFSLGIGLIYYFNDGYDMMKKIFLVSVFVMLGAFILGLFVVLPPLVFIEYRTYKKDDKIKTVLDSKTFLLKNGLVAVSDEKKSIGEAQLLSNAFAGNNLNEQGPVHDVPFSKLEIIDEVYCVKHINGTIVADVHERILYTKHPFREDTIGEAKIEPYYYYYQKDVRGQIIWYDNICLWGLLMQALNGLVKK